MPLIPKSQKNIIALIDSANLAFRFAHSFRGMSIKTQNGTEVATGIIYGMLDTIWKLKELYNINDAIFVLEGPHENNPRRKHPVYKSKRATSVSVDITSEMTLIKELAPKLGMLSIVPVKGEADDGIAFCIENIKLPNVEFLVCSGDHDMQVLLQPNVKIIKSANKNEQNATTFTEQNFWDENGFSPKLFSLFMAVTGDSSDSIPGIKGIGPKKGSVIFKELTSRGVTINYKSLANELIKTYPKILDGRSVDDIYNKISEYHNLTRIRNNWPVSTLTPEQPNRAYIKKIFELMKMKSFLMRHEEILTNCNTFYKTSLHIHKKLTRRQRDSSF